MKTTPVIILLLLVGLIFSCAKEDEISNQESSLQPEDLAKIELENTPLDLKDLSISIQGAEEKTEEFTPNGLISLTVPSTKSLALSGTQFTVEFNSKDDFEGVYLQLQNTDGAKATSYFGGISYNGKSLKKNKKATFLSKNTKIAEASNITGSYQFSVDLDSSVKPGTFCYSIWVYDAQGNISKPQEVCVTVKALGGNSNLVGTWNESKSIYDGVTYYPYEWYDFGYVDQSCKKYLKRLGQSALYSYVFNADGTYVEYEYVNKHKTTEDVIDNYDTCTIKEEVTQIENETFIEKGKWAYDAESKNLIYSISSHQTVNAAGTVVSEYDWSHNSFDETRITIFDSNFVLYLEANEYDSEAWEYFDKK